MESEFTTRNMARVAVRGAKLQAPWRSIRNSQLPIRQKWAELNPEVRDVRSTALARAVYLALAGEDGALFQPGIPNTTVFRRW